MSARLAAGRRTGLAVAALALGSIGCGPSAEPGGSAVLVTLEAVRRDAVGAYGEGGPTPALDRFARHAVRYREARTPAPLSRPAHASLLSGLYPPRHAVRGEQGEVLSDRVRTLAERARRAGFQTAAFLSSRLLDRTSGLHQGFDRFDVPRPAPSAASSGRDRSGAEVVAEAAAWLRARDRRRPFFLWVHLADAHPPRPGVSGAARLELAASLEAAAPGETERESALLRYAAAVRTTDRAFGELTDTLRHERLFQSTFVAVAADHGEGLGEHGESAHGLALFDSTLRVPLLLGYPDGFGAGVESSEVVSLVDLYPTLLDAMGIERARDEGPEHTPDGISLYYQSVASDRSVYFESYAGWDRFGWSPLVGAADARGKLVRGAREELFDLRNDPDERTPLGVSDGAPEVYLARIDSVWGAPGPMATGPLDATALRPELAVDPEWLARMAALGHEPPLGAPSRRPRPEQLSGRRDPRAGLSDHERFERVRRTLAAGDYAGALPELEALRALDPAAIDVLEALAEALAGAGRIAEAVEVLRSRLTLPPETVETHAALCECLTQLGEREQARLHSVRSLELLVERHRLRGDVEPLRRTRALLDRARREGPAREPGATETGAPRALEKHGAPAQDLRN